MINLKDIPLIFLFSILFSLNLYSFDEKEKFYITCKVIDQQVMSIEDGKSKRFSGFKDGLEVGEVFNINFSFSGWTDEQSYQFKVDSDKLGTAIYMTSKDLNMELVTTEGQINHVRGTNTSIFSKDYIAWEDIFNQVVLTRYYKNDWQLVYNRDISFDNIGHLLTANCMGVTSRYDNMIKRMLEIYEKY